MSQGEEALRELINTLETSELTNEVIEWIRTVCQPEQLLIDSLVKEFMGSLAKDPDYCNKILKALLLLYEGATDLVTPQFNASEGFMAGLIYYIKYTPIEQLEGSSFILLTQLFIVDKDKSLADEEFVRKLFDSLSFLKSEQVIRDVVLLLVRLSHAAETVSQNKVLEVCESHANQRFFSETLAPLINKAGAKKNFELYNFIKDYHGYTDRPLFYKNDLNVTIEILLQQVIEIVSIKNTGTLVLDALEALVNTAEYMKTRHMQEEFNQRQKEFKSMGSLGTIRKDNYEHFKRIVDKVNQS